MKSRKTLAEAEKILELACKGKVVSVGSLRRLAEQCREDSNFTSKLARKLESTPKEVITALRDRAAQLEAMRPPSKSYRIRWTQRR